MMSWFTHNRQKYHHCMMTILPINIKDLRDQVPLITETKSKIANRHSWTEMFRLVRLSICLHRTNPYNTQRWCLVATIHVNADRNRSEWKQRHTENSDFAGIVMKTVQCIKL